MKNGAKRHIYEYSLIAVGAFFLAAGLNLFLVPLNLSAGGFSTLGTVFLHFFKIPMSVTNIAFNVVLFALGYKFLGKGSVLKTAAGVLFLSLFLELTKHANKLLVSLAGIDVGAMGDMILASVIGGVFVGVGVGLVIKPGGSTGGSDLAGLILKKFLPHVPTAMLILIIDMTVIGIAGLVFRSLEITFYSAVATFITAKVADFIATLGDAAKSIYIISEKYEDIKALILSKHDRGVTEIQSRGAYSGSERPMLLCVVSPKQAPKLVNDIKAIDSKAFIVISDAREVLGEGFKNV